FGLENVLRLIDAVDRHRKEPIHDLDLIINQIAQSDGREKEASIAVRVGAVLDQGLNLVAVELEFDQRFADIGMNLADDRLPRAGELHHPAMRVENVRAVTGPIQVVVKGIKQFTQFATRVQGSDRCAARDRAGKYHRAIRASKKGV